MKQSLTGRYGLIFGLILGLLFGLTQAPAWAGTQYNPQSFAAAQKTGKSILIAITADWCPTCTAQRAILGRLERDPAFSDYIFMEVDYDNQKPVVRAVQARAQSTLILYRGQQEVGRSVGETREPAIRALLEQGRDR